MSCFRYIKILARLLIFANYAVFGSLKVGYWTTWDINCGIATYTENLCTALNNRGVETFVYDARLNSNVILRKIIADKINILNIQFEQRFLPPLNEMLSILDEIKKHDTKIIVIIHTEEKALSKIQDKISAFICLRQLQKLILDPLKINIFPHGVPIFNPPNSKLELRKKYGFSDNDKILSTFGFMLTNKKLLEILGLLTPFIKANPNYKIQLLTAYNHFAYDEGEDIKNKINNLIQEFDLQTQVLHITKFLSQQEILERLWISDLGFLWQDSDSNTTSGAAKTFISARLPIVLNKSSHFHDHISGVIKTASDFNSYVNAITNLWDDAIKLKELSNELEDQYKQLNYDNVILKHIDVFNKCLEY